MTTKKKIDFSAYLNYHPQEQTTSPPKLEPKVDMSIWHQKHSGGESKFVFKETVSDLGVVQTEVEYRKALPIVITEGDINRWLLEGSPMY